jgi:hypothetical protein
MELTMRWWHKAAKTLQSLCAKIKTLRSLWSTQEKLKRFLKKFQGKTTRITLRAGKSTKR